MRSSNLLLLSLVLGLAASCGVHEHPWAKGPMNQPAPTGSGGQPVTPGSDAGTGGMTGTGIPDGGVADAGGTPPPVAKEKMIAFIHFGHSNMAGRGNGPEEERPFFFETMPRAWMYHVDTGWELVREPFSAGDQNTVSRMRGGPGTAIIKTAIKAAAADYHFVSLGYGRNSAYCSQYLPGAVYHDDMIAAIRDLKGKVTFGAMFVMLGITERHGTEEDRSGYPNCINRLATFIRTEVDAPDMPLLLTDYEVTSTGQFVVGGEVEQAIRPQIMMVPMVVTRAALVPTDGLALEDDHHFQLDSHRIWAERAIQIMKDKGWFIWGAPP